MARTAREALPVGEAGLSTEEQAQLDEMRASDNETPEPEPPPEPVEQPSDEPAPQDEGGDEPPLAADRRPQMVPHAALHEERIRRQQLEQTLTTERQARQTLEQRTNQLLERMQQAPQQQGQPIQPPPLPDPQADPVGHIMARLQRAEDARMQQEQVLGAVLQAMQNQNQQGQQAQAAQTIQQRAVALERGFAAETPDYVAAVDYLNEMRHRQLIEAGVTDPAERQAFIAQEAMSTAARALQAERNPAEMIYRIAKASGFTGSAPAATNGNGDAQAPSAGQRLDQIGRGQRQSQQSLGSVRGNAPPPLTAQRLLEMNNDDFAKMLETQEGKDLLGV